MEQDKAAPLLFHGQQVPDNMIHSWQGDLTEFIGLMSAQGRLVVMVESIENNEIAGFYWMDDIIPNYRALVSIFFRKKYYGATSKEASKLFINYALNGIGFKHLWAFTPFPWAAKHAQGVGFSKVAELPGMYLIDDKPQSSYVLKIDKESYYG